MCHRKKGGFSEAMSNELITDSLRKVFTDVFVKLKNQGHSEEKIFDLIQNADLEPELSSCIEESAKNAVNYYKSNMYEIAYEERLENDQFLAHQNLIWGKCFVASQTMYVMAVETAEIFSRDVFNEIEEDLRKIKIHTFIALQHIHGRACQVYLEILCLLRNGFADAAFARWRTMYELSCVGAFIKQQGETIAEQYINKSKTDDRPYDWTTGAINSKGNVIKIKSFKTLERVVNESQSESYKDAWEKQYKLACLVTHGGPQGTLSRLSNGPNSNVIPVGPSDYGIATAAEHSAISLQYISMLFLTVFPDFESLYRFIALNSWVEVIRDYYFAAEKQAFGYLIEEQEDDDGNQ